MRTGIIVDVHQGFSVAESFAYEKPYLRPLPLHFPALSVKESRTRVRRDGTVFFDGNYYQVPGLYRDRAVLCRHTGHEILIDHEGDEIGRFAALPQARGMCGVFVIYEKYPKRSNGNGQKNRQNSPQKSWGGMDEKPCRISCREETCSE